MAAVIVMTSLLYIIPLHVVSICTLNLISIVIFITRYNAVQCNRHTVRLYLSMLSMYWWLRSRRKSERRRVRYLSLFDVHCSGQYSHTGVMSPWWQAQVPYYRNTTNKRHLRRWIFGLLTPPIQCTSCEPAAFCDHSMFLTPYVWTFVQKCV